MLFPTLHVFGWSSSFDTSCCSPLLLFCQFLVLQKRNGANQEREAEKKKEQEKDEKRLGILTFLGQTVTDQGELTQECL